MSSSLDSSRLGNQWDVLLYSEHLDNLKVSMFGVPGPLNIQISFQA